MCLRSTTSTSSANTTRGTSRITVRAIHYRLGSIIVTVMDSLEMDSLSYSAFQLSPEVVAPHGPRMRQSLLKFFRIAEQIQLSINAFRGYSVASALATYELVVSGNDRRTLPVYGAALLSLLRFRVNTEVAAGSGG
jgi:hypothetical protein